MQKEKRNILTKENMDKSKMIRFVCGPNYEIYPDLAEKLPGRGMWIEANKKALQEVINKKIFNKSCHLDCKIPENFIEEVFSLLKKRVLNSLSFSKKSGDLSLGFDKVKENSNPSIIIIASDSGHDGKEKILHTISEKTLVIDYFTGHELQLAFGTDTVVVYACIDHSKMAKKVIEDYSKLLGFI